jgi:phosphatidylglycerol:prolipoprotein diacylglycerol transferase
VPPSLPEHLLLPLGLLIFAVAYVIGFSKRIETPWIRQATRVLSFVPAVLLYVLLKPETFAATASIQYSTSQAVALATAFAGSVAFAVYYRAALAHPAAAMELHLPSDEASRKVADEDDEDAGGEGKEDDAEAEEMSAPPKKTGGKKKAKKGTAKKKKAAAVDDEDEDADAKGDGGEPGDGDDQRGGDGDDEGEPRKRAAPEED